MKTRRTQIAMGLALAAALAAGGAAVAWRGGSRAAGSGSAGVMHIGPRVPGPTADQEGSRPPGGRSAIGLQTTATARTAARRAEDGVVGMPPARKQRSAKAPFSAPRSRAPSAVSPLQVSRGTAARRDRPVPSPRPAPASPATRASESGGSSPQAAASSAEGSGGPAEGGANAGSEGGASDAGGTAAVTSGGTAGTDGPGTDAAQANLAPRLTPPKLLAATGADYPSDAFRLTVRRQDLGSGFAVEGAEGIVAVRVLVRSDGAVSRVEVAASSGSDVLDRAAADAVRRWQFAPAMRDGVPIDAYATLKIRYVVR